jgi:hypothetical protein
MPVSEFSEVVLDQSNKSDLNDPAWLLNLPCQAAGRRQNGCAEKRDFALSLVYSRKKSLLKIENSHKKSAGETRAEKSVSAFSYGCNSLFLTFMARRRMPPLDFTSSENFDHLLSHV